MNIENGAGPGANNPDTIFSPQALREIRKEIGVVLSRLAEEPALADVPKLLFPFGTKLDGREVCVSSNFDRATRWYKFVLLHPVTRDVIYAEQFKSMWHNGRHGFMIAPANLDAPPFSSLRRAA